MKFRIRDDIGRREREGDGGVVREVRHEVVLSMIQGRVGVVVACWVNDRSFPSSLALMTSFCILEAHKGTGDANKEQTIGGIKVLTSRVFLNPVELKLFEM